MRRIDHQVLMERIYRTTGSIRLVEDEIAQALLSPLDRIGLLMELRHLEHAVQRLHQRLGKR
jgi:hypothetical protein